MEVVSQGDEIGIGIGIGIEIGIYMEVRKKYNARME